MVHDVMLHKMQQMKEGNSEQRSWKKREPLEKGEGSSRQQK